MKQRPFWKSGIKQAPGAKRRATIAALIEQHRARTGEILTRPDIAKILAMSPARVAMHLEALAREETRKGGGNKSEGSKNIRVQGAQLSFPRGRR